MQSKPCESRRILTSENTLRVSSFRAVCVGDVMILQELPGISETLDLSQIVCLRYNQR